MGAGVLQNGSMDHWKANCPAQCWGPTVGAGVLQLHMRCMDHWKAENPGSDPRRGWDGQGVRGAVPPPGQLSAERTGDTMAGVGQPEGAACGPTPGAVRGLAGDQPGYTRERGRLQDPTGPPGATRGSSHVRGLRGLDMRAWAMSSVPKHLARRGQERLGLPSRGCLLTTVFRAAAGHGVRATSSRGSSRRETPPR